MPVAPILSSERLVLSPLSTADREPLLGLFSKEPVNRYLLDGRVPEADWVAEVVADSQADFLRRGLGFWTARRREQPTGDAPGWCGLVGYRDFHDPPVEELVYALDPGAWGVGLASEMVAVVIEYAFEVGRDRVRASVDLPNEGSLRLLRRLGFRQTHREARSSDQPWDQLHWELVRE